MSNLAIGLLYAISELTVALMVIVRQWGTLNLGRRTLSHLRGDHIASSNDADGVSRFRHNVHLANHVSRGADLSLTD